MISGGRAFWAEYGPGPGQGPVGGQSDERERVWMHWKGYEESLDLAYITPLSRWHGLGHRKVFPGPWLISKVKETAFE